MGTDYKAAVWVIGPNTEGFIQNLLRKLRKNGCEIIRLPKSKKGHLLAFLSGEPANVRLDKIFFLVNQLGSPLGHNVPGKNRFFRSGRVGTFPHEHAIFLGAGTPTVHHLL